MSASKRLEENNKMKKLRNIVRMGNKQTADARSFSFD